MRLLKKSNWLNITSALTHLLKQSSTTFQLMPIASEGTPGYIQLKHYWLIHAEHKWHSPQTHLPFLHCKSHSSVVLLSHQFYIHCNQRNQNFAFASTFRYSLLKKMPGSSENRYNDSNQRFQNDDGQLTRRELLKVAFMRNEKRIQHLEKLVADLSKELLIPTEKFSTSRKIEDTSRIEDWMRVCLNFVKWSKPLKGQGVMSNQSWLYFPDLLSTPYTVLCA